MIAGSKCGYLCLLIYFEKFFNVMVKQFYVILTIMYVSTLNQ